MDPSQSTSDAIVAEAATRASKDAELEANLNALGPKIGQIDNLLHDGETAVKDSKARTSGFVNMLETVSVAQGKKYKVVFKANGTGAAFSIMFHYGSSSYDTLVQSTDGSSTYEGTFIARLSANDAYFTIYSPSGSWTSFDLLFKEDGDEGIIDRIAINSTNISETSILAGVTDTRIKNADVKNIPIVPVEGSTFTPQSSYSTYLVSENYVNKKSVTEYFDTITTNLQGTSAKLYVILTSKELATGMCVNDFTNDIIWQTNSFTNDGKYKIELGKVYAIKPSQTLFIVAIGSTKCKFITWSVSASSQEGGYFGFTNTSSSANESSTFTKATGEYRCVPPVLSLSNNLAENNDAEPTISLSYENFKAADCDWYNGNSTFSGWGFTLCNGTDLGIKKLKIKVKNRDSNTMTKVVFALYKNVFDASNLLASKTVSVSISANAESFVECEFDDVVHYDGLIFFLYACDALVTRFGLPIDSSSYPYSPADDEHYPKHKFKTGGSTDIASATNLVNNQTAACWTEITVKKVIDEDTLKDIIEDTIGGGASNKVDICVPDTIYAVVGDTLQLYYDEIFRCVNVGNYDVNVVCGIGAQYPRYYELTPTASQVGSRTIQFKIKDNNNNTIASKTCTLVVSSAGSSPSSAINVLCVGASATQGGEWAGELKRRLTTSNGTPAGSDLSNINFVGRNQVTRGGLVVNIEGNGGYKFTNYTSVDTLRYRFNVTAANEPNISVGDVYSNNGCQFTIVEINITAGQGGYFSCDGTGNPTYTGTLTKVSGDGDATITFSTSGQSGNPFAYNGAIDIAQYAEDYCNGKIDVVYTELFGNGTQPYVDDNSERLSQMQDFIDMFLAEFPSCKFCIGLFWNPDIRGGLGTNYGAGGGWTFGYGIKYTNMSLCTELQEYINENNLGDKVFICNWLNEFDTPNNMRQTTKKVNPRSSTTEIFGTNGVHPSDVGYYQMADTAWRLFVSKFCQ